MTIPERDFLHPIEKPIAFLHEIQPNEVMRYGGKAVNTAQLHRFGFPVPKGFSISAEFYDTFTKEPEIAALIQKLDATDDLEVIMSSAMELEAKAQVYSIPSALREMVRSALRELEHRVGPSECGYAVRSSATVEDGNSLSFAGQAETYLCVMSETDLMDAIRDVWTSVLTTRAVLYLQGKKVPLNQVKMSVIIQQMIPSDVAGVMFTANVVSKDKSQVMIDSTWGLGEPLVAGKITPDTFVVDKESRTIIESRVGIKKSMMIAEKSGAQIVDVEPHLQEQPSLSEDTLNRIVDAGIAIERKMGTPQDIEWCFRGNDLVILQSRPITTL